MTTGQCMFFALEPRSCACPVFSPSFPAEVSTVTWDTSMGHYAFVATNGTIDHIKNNDTGDAAALPMNISFATESAEWVIKDNWLPTASLVHVATSMTMPVKVAFGPGANKALGKHCVCFQTKEVMDNKDKECFRTTTKQTRTMDKNNGQQRQGV
eukprot:1374253-Lingulodinium_polyedra.AAC.1